MLATTGTHISAR